MTARENILARVAATSAAGNRAPGVVNDTLRSPVRGPAPPMDPDPIGRFRERALGLASDVLECDSLAGVPEAVARYLDAHGLPRRAACWPELGVLPWGETGIRIEARAARGDASVNGTADLVGITSVFCAIAETGTLMLLSGPETPATVSLLPETHVAVVQAERVVATMEDAWSRLRAEKGVVPRAVNFVSGPSRTADIEQIVTLGAHGPYRVCIVLVTSGRGPRTA